MSLPPPALLPHLNRFPSERFLGSLLTAGVHYFRPHKLADPPRTAAIWALATHRRLWLVAFEPAFEQTWAVAVGRADAARVEHGWKRDTLHVGRWAVPLRRGERSQAEALLTRWARAEPQGDPYPEPSAPSPPTPSAEGGLATPGPAVPRSGPKERALCALPTQFTVPTSDWAGPVEATAWLWISTHRSAIIVPSPHGEPPWMRPIPVGPASLDGQGLAVEGARLHVKAARTTAELALALLAIRAPADRWALAARQAIITGEPERALHLLAEAWALGAGDRSWPHLAQIALAFDQGPLATAAVWRALTVHEGIDPHGLTALWQREDGALRRSVRATQLTWARARAVISEPLDALVHHPAPPPDLPAPPRSPSEVWATALAMHGRFDEARSTWRDLGPQPDPRDALAHAALAHAAGQPDAAEAWQRAAEAAYDHNAPPWWALAQATGLHETAARRWRWGAWAWAEGRPDEARASWRRALALDEGEGALSEPLPTDALRALAQVAVNAERPPVAVTVLRAAVHADPTHEPTRLQLADLLDEALRQPLRAADQSIALARDLEDGVLHAPHQTRWQHYTQAAARLARGGDPDGALSALHQAVAGSVLDAEALRGALACPGVFVPRALREWWAHIAAALDPAGSDDRGQPLPARPPVSEDDLRELWPFDDDLAAHTHGAPTPIAAATLTRGLDDAQRAGHPDLQRTVDAVCAELGLEPAPIAFVSRGDEAWGVSCWSSAPPVTLIGVEHLDADGPRYLDPGALRFALAAELAHLRCQHTMPRVERPAHGCRSPFALAVPAALASHAALSVASAVPIAPLRARVAALADLPSHAAPPRQVDRAVRLAEPVVSWLSPERAAPRHRAAQLAQVSLQRQIHADRVALRVTGDLHAALRALLRLSPTPACAARLTSDGLSAILADPHAALPPDLAVRAAALVRFATQQRLDPLGGGAAPTPRG